MKEFLGYGRSRSSSGKGDVIKRHFNEYVNVGMKGLDIPEEYITEEQIKNEAAEVKEWMMNKPFADVVFTSCLVNIESAMEIPEAMIYSIFVVDELYNIDLLWHIEEKMRYNQLREYKHGKSY